jgi:glyoxylase-like metal-dependent hydrolase (beta-lactamase superfamily II)
MTGPGTNTYVIGDTELAVIDPGPAIPSHIEAILAFVGERLRYVVCTHTHPDHSPGAAVLAAKTGATLVGRVTADDRHQDLTFQPESRWRMMRVLQVMGGRCGRSVPPGM